MTPVTSAARRTLLALFAACAAAAAQAGMGMIELPGTQGHGPVTVFHPTAAQDQAQRRGPFTIRMVPGAPPARGNGRLVVVSHGSGGGPWVHTDLAHALVDAGFVVAMPQHRGDNWRDSSDQGPESWKRRPAEVSHAIDAVAQDPRLAPLLVLDKVGVFGQSAGGHTALTLAGGSWSPARFKAHCMAHIAQDFPACVGTYTRLRGNGLDGLKQKIARGVLALRFGNDTPQAHGDPRIAAAVAGVPAAADFDDSSLVHPRVPLGLVTAGRDIWLKPQYHSERVLRACSPRCELIAHLPQGGHSIMLSPLPPMEVLSPIEQELLADPPGFERSQLPQVHHAIALFFRKHLLP